MGYFKEWIVKENSPKKDQQKDPQNDHEKVIKNCPVHVSLKEETKEKIIRNCFMKDKKDNFTVEKIDS